MSKETRSGHFSTPRAATGSRTWTASRRGLVLNVFIRNLVNKENVRRLKLPRTPNSCSSKGSLSGTCPLLEWRSIVALASIVQKRSSRKVFSLSGSSRKNARLLQGQEDSSDGADPGAAERSAGVFAKGAAARDEIDS